MFKSYNYFRSYNGDRKIEDHKKFYKYFSNNVEFGGNHTSRDYLINNRFLETLNTVVSTILRAQPKNILDLGCGAGVYLPLSNYFPDIPYHGVDYAENSIAAAKLAYPNAKFSNGDLFDFKSPKKADLIILSLVLILYEKKADRDKILTTLRNNLSTDGCGIVIVWKDNIFIQICQILSRVIAYARGIPLPQDFMCLHFSEKEMRSDFNRNQLVVVDVKHTSPRYGALECAQYLSLQKYKRNFAEEVELHKKKISLAEFEDFCEDSGSSSLWVRALYKASFLFPSWFAMHSAYIVRKRV